MSWYKLADCSTLKGKLIIGSSGVVLSVLSVLGYVAIRGTNIRQEAAIATGFGTFSTNFPLSENPISENGNWINGATVGLDWANVQTTGGIAEGVGPASAEYSDPTAIVRGTWGPNQTVTATIFSNEVEDKPSQAYDKEVEIRLRTSISPHRITGYEINCRTPNDSFSYIQIVRWNGALGDFTSLKMLDGTGCGNGDVLKATISGSTISVYRNGTLMLTARDRTFKAGNPGIGYNFGCGTAYDQFGFTSFIATDESTPDLAAPSSRSIKVIVGPGLISPPLNPRYD
jgi:hypothetical protein